MATGPDGTQEGIKYCLSAPAIRQQGDRCSTSGHINSHLFLLLLTALCGSNRSCYETVENLHQVLI